MSEWAPLCIGPYAQANVIDNHIVFVAGQIPLDPSNMMIITECDASSSVFNDNKPIINLFFNQLSLSLRHASRVLNTLNSCLKRSLTCLVYINQSFINQINKDMHKTFYSQSRSLVNLLMNNDCFDLHNDYDNTYDQNNCSGEESESDTDEKPVKNVILKYFTFIM